MDEVQQFELPGDSQDISELAAWSTQLLGVFAEFERSMIVERVKAGLKRAKAEGKVLGRPRVSVAVEAKVMVLRKQGRGMRAIARELGIGNCTVQRIVGVA